MVGFTQTCAGEAIVGRTKTIEILDPDQDIDVVKSAYRRPSDVPFPSGNPYTLKKATLGQRLFFDRRLSNSSAQSCASCHDPGFAWGDGLKVGVGNGMAKLPRRSPSIVNAAWSAAYMWDGSAASLEEQATRPIQSADEMNMPIEALLLRLASFPGYLSLFEEAFPGQGLTAKSLSDALATYERTIVSGRAPFDSWIDGDERAISDEAKRGFTVFNSKGHCSSCHEGWNFSNEGFHDIGLPGEDIGRGRFHPRVIKMNHAFKTPGLREVARRGPYMHDGSIATLEAVVEHYDRGGVDRPSRSDLIAPLHLSAEEKAELVAFLKSLSGNSRPVTIPTLPH